MINSGSIVSVGLRRELRIWEALALSVGLMSQALAMSASGAGAAGLVGRGVPLVFLFAGVGVCLVAYGFVYLSRSYAHAGNVYGLTGITLGPRAGFLSGWALLGAYTVFTPASLLAFGGFASLFCDQTGIWHGAPYLPFSLAGGLLVWALNSGDVKRLTRGLLGIEGASLLLIVVLMVVVVVRLAGHSGPGHLGLTGSVFTFGAGVGPHTIALGAVFGFLAFAGFEGAASLGEEAENPKRSIPRALIATVVGGAIFYVLCMTVQALGFGASAAGTNAFANSAGPLFDLAHSYVASGVAYALELGAAASAFGSALGSAAAGARMLYALARDGAPRGVLARLSERSGAPTPALHISEIDPTAAPAVGSVTGQSAVDFLGAVSARSSGDTLVAACIGRDEWCSS